MASEFASQEIELEHLATLLEDMEVELSYDLGSAVVHVGNHKHHGDVVLVNTICGRALCLRR